MLQSLLRYECYSVQGSDSAGFIPPRVRSAYVSFTHSRNPSSIVLLPESFLGESLDSLLRRTLIKTFTGTINSIYTELKAETLIPSPLLYRVYLLKGKDELGLIPEGINRVRVNYSKGKPHKVTLITVSSEGEYLSSIVEDNSDKVATLATLLEFARE
jgi:hypothetical protein